MIFFLSRMPFDVTSVMMTRRLGDHAVGLPGIRAITRTLSVNTSLKHLDVSNSLRIAPIDYRKLDFLRLTPDAQWKQMLERISRLKGASHNESFARLTHIIMSLA